MKLPTREDVEKYTQTILPLLEMGTVQRSGPHRCDSSASGEALHPVTPEERKTVRGYFYGGRGAREGNLALQYISWLVGENTGKESERIVFSEGITERIEAWDALAKFSVERKLSRLVLGDPAGLHRDVLSAATREYLLTFLPVQEVFKD